MVVGRSVRWDAPQRNAAGLPVAIVWFAAVDHEFGAIAGCDRIRVDYYKKEGLTNGTTFKEIV